MAGYLEFLHGQLSAILFGAFHQDIQRIAVILPLGAQWFLPDGLLNAFLQGVSRTDTLKDMKVAFVSHLYPCCLSL